MQTIEEKINTFKPLLAKARDLEEPWAYFFDSLATDNRFLAMGKPTTLDKIESMLRLIAVRALNSKGEIIPQRSLEIPRYQMLHGSCIIDGQLTIFCFFDDMNMGIACFMDPKNFLTRLVRLTRMDGVASENFDKTFVPHLKSSLLH